MHRTTLALLDTETAKLHPAAERCWRHLLGSEGATRADYAKQLSVTYGFEAPYEAACAYTPGLSNVIDLRGRARSGLLAQDLLTLGWTPAQLTTTSTYPVEPFQDPGEALGWMYVVERQTLLYEAVRAQLTSRFTDLAPATMYLNAYEGHTARRRAELGSALDRVCTSDRVRERTLLAATEAFEAVTRWHRTHVSALRSVG